MAIEGKRAEDIAAAMNVHPSTVWRVLADDQVKARVDHVRALLAEEAYEQSAKNVIRSIKEYGDKVKDPDKIDVLKKDHGFKASVKVLESMGVLASHAPSVYISQIYNSQTNNYISPVVDDALSRAITVVEAQEIGNDPD